MKGNDSLLYKNIVLNAITLFKLIQVRQKTIRCPLFTVFVKLADLAVCVQ